MNAAEQKTGSQPAASAALSGLSPIKLAVLAQRTRAQHEALLRADPIAIVGMACRFPGGADTPGAYWDILRDGRDAIVPVPAQRWDADAVFDADPSAPGKASVKNGGFIDAVDEFDAAFFGILPREAERMDPQQRVFLEVAVDALDDAGLSRERLAGSRTGVFVASYLSDYAQMAYSDREDIDARTLTGILHSVLANRLSYAFDLRGPSISIDTACSSSLVAIHLACQSLRYGESDIAIAGGVSLMLTADLMISLSKVGFMAPDGRSKTFDASADGFGRGEGCGVIVLKRLSDAIADGDRVLALVRGSAVNQDGHSTVLAAPNGLAQQALIREALKNAQVEPSSIGYVEAHGTGTALGDPIEVEALAATVGVPVDGAGVCLMGAAKANIGHMEAAAGVGGVIKSILILRYGAIPPQVHFRSLNPHINLDGTRLQIPVRLMPWPSGAVPRRIGTSGFGVGGTNAHVVLEEAPHLPVAAGRGPNPGPLLLPLSAQSPAALQALARRWIEFLPNIGSTLAAVCAAAGERRSHYDHRLAVVGSSATDLGARLQAFVESSSVAGLATGQPSPSGRSRLAFVFSGQGPQWFAMGRELGEQEPVFRDVLVDIDARLRKFAPWSLLEELAATEADSRLDQTEVAQPAIFAIQVALAALWKSWGIEPDGVVGHSIGEFAALYVAGVLTLDDAVRVVWHRAMAMQQATGQGAMAAVALDEAEAERIVMAYGADLSIAAINGPRSVVLSGRHEALAAALAALDQRGVSTRPLLVNYAFHSAQMEPFALQFVSAVGAVVTRAPSTPLYSTVSGAALGVQSIDADYFGRNLRQRVRFAAAIGAMIDDGFGTFLEIAPHPVLAASISEVSSARGVDAAPLASLRRGRPERETMLQACAGIYASGRAPHWETLNRGPADMVDLPSYPWQRERFWLRDRPLSESSSVGARRSPSRGQVGHELLGRRLQVAGARIFECSWPLEAPQWLADHRIAGRLLMPGAGMMEALRVAACDALGSDDAVLCDFVVHHPLLLGEPGERAVTWQVIVQQVVDSKFQVTLFEAVPAVDDSEIVWREIASAHARPNDAMTVPAVLAEPSLLAVPAQQALYAAFASLGVNFGRHFQTVRGLEVRDSEFSGRLEYAQGELAAADALRGVHPTVLDGAFQLCLVAATGGDTLVPRELLLPLAVDRYRVLHPMPRHVLVQAQLHREGTRGSLSADVQLRGVDGALVAVLEGVRFAPANAQALAALTGEDAWLYQVGWQAAAAPAAIPVSASPKGAWILFVDGGQSGDSGEALAATLSAQGSPCLRVRAGDSLQQLSSDLWSVDPTEPAHFDAILNLLAWRAGAPLAGAAHLWSLDPLVLAGGDAAISALYLLQALARSNAQSATLAIVTRGAQPAGTATPSPQAAALWGLAASAAVEMPDLRCRVIDLDSDAVNVDIPGLAGELLLTGEVPERLALRGARRLVPQLRRLRLRDRGGTVRLSVGDSATLDVLKWLPARAPAPVTGEVRLRVLAAGVNFRDVMLALGMYPNGADLPLGAECAGIVESVGPDVANLKAGDVVFGYVARSLASDVTAPAAFLSRLPAAVSAEQAAGLPAAYLTAIYGLHRVAGIRAGMRVLIHAGAGGVGMAAVQLALRAGAEVFATAGSVLKRDLLKSMGVAQVFDSRSLNFASQLNELTRGAGVDIVLNSLAGEFIAASFAVLARNGCFLELGKRDIRSIEEVRRERPDARYVAYDLSELAAADNSLIESMLRELVAALEDGSLRPLPVRVFEFDEAPEAFRFMAQARHIGKLVLRAPRAGVSRVVEMPLVHADATYWITGGLGALGVRTARWLVESGARHLVLSGRHAPAEQPAAILRECARLGAQIQVRLVDAADGPAMRGVLDDIKRGMPPLRGVVHAAGALGDGVLMQQNADRWMKTQRGKAQGAHVLHALTRDLALDFFVMYSAASLLLGPAGQGPYAAANAELDALAYARRSEGLPALSVAWGMWAEAGMIADSARGAETWSARGLGWISPAMGFAYLERLLRAGVTHAAVLPIDWSRFIASLPSQRDPEYFRAVAPVASPSKSAATASGDRHVTAVEQWRSAPLAQRRSLITTHLLEKTLGILGLDPMTMIEPNTPLKDAGLDSLMAVELRNALARSIGHPLPATLLFDYPSLDALTTYLMRTLILNAESTLGSAAVRSAATDAIASLSDAEAEAQLLAELDASASGSAS